VKASPVHASPAKASRAKASRVKARTALLGVGLVVVLAVIAVFPLVVTNTLDTQFAVLTLMFVAAVAGWNLFSGYSGYISLGHAVFFGVGAYTVALLTEHWHLNGGQIFELIPLGAVMAAVFSVPVGLVALRVRRHTFVVVTIAVFFIFQLMAYNFGFTGSSNGISTPFFSWSPTTYNNPFYYAAFVLAVAAVLLGWAIRGSRFGLQLLAIRDDEDRARGLGVRTWRVKLTAFVISATVVGAVGGLWFIFIGQVLPETAFDPNLDLSIALMAFLGGFGTIAGPVIGALILEPLQQYVKLQFTNGYIGQIFLGLLFLLVILFLPRGIVPTVSERVTSLRARWQRRGQPPPGAGAPAVARPQAAGAPEASTETSTETSTGSVR
jgi:branched-chain amino acid transport system permease protein